MRRTIGYIWGFRGLFTLRKFGCDNNSRHHLPQRVWQSLWRLDSLSIHFNSLVLLASAFPQFQFAAYDKVLTDELGLP